ncbi:MAG: glycoside hydrolase family 88 protein [Bryobacterales bacterium]|nr:glycoside hydrolase family 88 protein [Bryobacterales bacterium]MDE0262157.1 glycoside hydrolase family 88 protein [Bryobacterales bacterium]MDE0621373.1 glycoside hydrolase family 88 protein [Bryobacterales bacterium]
MPEAAQDRRISGRKLCGTLPAAAALCLALPPLAAAEVFHTSIGVSAAGSPIRAGIGWHPADFAAPAPRILLVAGLDGSQESVDLAAALLRHSGDGPFALSIVLNAFPDREPVERFPPIGPAYGGDAVEAQYLWRFVGTLAPDLVVDLRFDDRPSALAGALQRGLSPADVGRVPAATLRLAANGKTLDELRREATEVLAALAGSQPPSGARRELQDRVSRSPVEVAGQLALVYGHTLDTATYIPALALIGRLRLGDIAGESPLADVEQIVAPFLGGKASLGDRPSGSTISGHLVFADLYERTNNPAYLALARAAADLGFEPDGSLKSSMPSHNEMSDSVFMGCAILARVGRLTGEKRYFEMALRHLRFMQDLDLRSDGLYRHSPLDEAAWGRGNGFPALGLALALSDWPKEHPGSAEAQASYLAHMRAMARHQDPTGMWHQVVDRPESYREFTSTAMTGFAITRGLRRGWLDRGEFEPVANRAWKAVLARIKSDATLVDVCRSTGRQTSLRAYFNREAILGRDDRGGAMALLFATERARWESER